MNKHFELTAETKNHFGVTLHRIKALVDLPHAGVKAGDLGGWVESIENLSGEAWVSDEARVSGEARVFDKARVFGKAQVEKTKEYLVIGPLGSDRFITLTKSDRQVAAGCFRGGLAAFQEAVSAKYGSGSDYDMLIELCKIYFA